MTIVRPTAALGIESADAGLLAGAASLLGGGPLDLAQAGVHHLAIDLSVGRDHDRIMLELSHLSPLATAEPGATLSVGLGADGDPADVLSAEVRRVDDRPGTISLVALAPSHRLATAAVSRTYLSQTAADIVNDLLQAGEVEAGSIVAAASLPVYHVDSRRSVWANLHLLALRVGATITCGSGGEVCFEPSPGAAAGGLSGAAAAATTAISTALGGGDTTLRQGADLIDWQLGPRRAEPVPTPAVVPLGAASPLGSDRAHHLLKHPDSGAGDGPTVVDPSLRDTASADGAAAAIGARAARATAGGRLSVPGDPGLRAGRPVTVDEQTWHTLAVRHRFDPFDGYRCELLVEAMA